ncbi:MAG: peptidoglycan-N-acetylglucosamine deacetylase [Solirubrobacteraceae bacterium]|jgi:peptidoglycan/xylan/chitin deacetylase (PgdA/CDA1 family)|nr:peptidoglycan-N-acetylglucosamine deacetylase [Solirubrobacteraceae bacterium]
MDPFPRSRRALRATYALLVVLAAVLAQSAAASRAPGPARVADALDTPASPLDLTSVSFGQVHERMALQVTTAGEWTAADLVPGSGRSICVRLFYGPVPGPRARLCVISEGGAPALRYTRLDRAGNAVALRRVPATVGRADAHSLLATFTPAAAGLVPGRYSWQAQSQWTDPAVCAAPPGCSDVVPDAGSIAARIGPLQVAAARGCVPRGPEQRTSGFPGRREVALTFDDGPSAYTPAILTLLEREHVPGTFFMVGKEVPGHAALLHRMLRDGFMIGNHTFTHANVSGGGGLAAQQIAATQAVIRRASGFTPCLFRPPGGATSGALQATAASLGLLTIIWNVDPRDWSTPGTGSIVSTVLAQTRPGSIILLHDGGGARSETVAAVPQIVRTLTARGYHFVTVAQLLGLALRQ